MPRSSMCFHMASKYVILSSMQKPSMPLVVKLAVTLLFAGGIVVTYFVIKMTCESLVSPVCDRDFRIAIVSIPLYSFVILLWFSNVVFVCRGKSASRFGLVVWVFLSASPVIIANGTGDHLTIGKFYPLLVTIVPCVLLFLPAANQWFKECGKLAEHGRQSDVAKAIEHLQSIYPDFSQKSADEQMDLIRKEMGGQN